MDKQSLVEQVDKNFILKHYHDVVGLDVQMSRLVRVLSRKIKNNAIIIGEQGVGKTAFFEAFLLRYFKEEGSIPLSIKSARRVDTSLLASVFSANGNYSFLDFDNDSNPFYAELLIVDDISSVLELDKRNVYKLSAILAPTAKDVDSRVIMTATPAQYRTYLENNSLFASFFENIYITEPSAKMSEDILKFLSDSLLSTYNVSIDSDVVSALVALSKRYIYGGKSLPGKALDLFDEGLAKTSLEQRSVFTVSDIKQIISERTGIPVSSITTSEKEKLLKLEQNLRNKVIGQDRAVRSVSQVIKRSRVGIKDPKRPIGSFLFLGSSGVGKTELAKQLAEEVFFDETALVRIDMSEYSEGHNVQRLIGAPPGYIGYEEGGQLTNPVWDRPYSLILLDEIEKAHPRVFDIFLQIIDEGRLTDGQGRTVNFNNTVIIATSNIGIDKLVTEENLNAIGTREFINSKVIPLLITHFRPEFINRFDEIVMFEPLSKPALKKITELRLFELQNRLKDLDIKIKFRKETVEDIVNNCSNPKFGARPINRLIREKIENPISERVLKDQIIPAQTLVL